LPLGWQLIESGWFMGEFFWWVATPKGHSVSCHPYGHSVSCRFDELPLRWVATPPYIVSDSCLGRVFNFKLVCFLLWVWLQCKEKHNYIMVKSLIFELSSHQISEPNNRLSVRTVISQRSQRCSLINQRGRRISLFPNVFPYVALPTWYTDADRRYLGFDQHSHTHTFSLSVSLLPCLVFFHL
jgi:hypothetical protein